VIPESAIRQIELVSKNDPSEGKVMIVRLDFDSPDIYP
jgi:hypothetical protein